MPMRKSYPCVRAMDANSCGPAALATVVRFHGGSISQARLRELAGTDLQGTSLEALGGAAERVGFNVTHGSTSFTKLISAPLPAIVHLNALLDGHFVVLFKATNTHVVISDPAAGVRRIPTPHFCSLWSGNVLLLEPIRPLINETTAPRSYTLLAHLIEEKRIIVGALAATLCNVGVSLALGFSLQLLIDKALPLRNYKTVELLGVALFGITLLKGVLAATNAYLSPVVVRNINNRERERYIADLLCKTQLFFDRHRLGDLFSRVFDVNKLSAALTSALLSVWSSAILTVISLTILTRFSPVLGASCLLSLLIYVLMAILSLRRLRDPELHISHLTSQLAGVFVENVGNIRIIKSYTAEEAFSQKITETYEELQNALFDKSRKLGTISSTMALINGLASICILLLSTCIVLKGGMTIGNVVFIYSAVGLFLTSLEGLGPSLGLIQDGLIGVERLKEFEPLKNEENRGTKLSVCDTGLSIDLRNLMFEYRPGSPILKGLSLTIPPGACVAILGETGCGKSTLGYLLAGLYNPAGGQLFFDGIDASHLSVESIRQHVAIVFQESGILASSIRDNITLGMDPSRWSVSELRRAAQDAYAHEFIERLPRQYDHEIGSRGTSLSSGQRQRIALARALLRAPRLLILDEATSNLDIATERHVIDSLGLYERKRTIVIITHRLTTAALADTVIIMSDGAVVEMGSPSELVERPSRYQEMWLMQEGQNRRLSAKQQDTVDQIEVG